MKTKTGIINAILLTLTMVLTPAANALAADYAAGEAAVSSMNGDAKQYLLPGDTVSAYNSLNVNAMDGSSVYTEEPEDPASSVWTNDPETGTVYSIDAQQTVLDDGVTTANSVTLNAAGYEVTVYDGTFDQTTDFVPVFSLNGDETNEVHAWFAPGAKFKLIANPASDGQQFIGWSIDDVHADQPQATFGETAEDGTTTVTLSAALAEPVVIRATYTAAAQQAAAPETDTQDTSSDPSAADAGQPETGTADPSASASGQPETSAADLSASQPDTTDDGTQITTQDEQNVDIMGYSDGTQAAGEDVQESENVSADYSVVIAPNDLGLVPDVTYYDENWEWMTPASDENGNSTVPAGTYVYVQAQAAPEGYTFGNITVTDANGAGVQYGYVNEGDASFIYFTMPETSVTVTTTYTAAAPEETGSTAQADSTEAAETQPESTEAQPESTEALTAAVVPTESTEVQPESTEAQTAPETQNSTEAQTETEITVQTLDAAADNGTTVTLNAEEGFPEGSTASVSQVSGDELSAAVQKIEEGNDSKVAADTAVAYDIRVTDQNETAVEPTAPVQTSITLNSDEEYQAAKNSRLYHVKEDGTVEEIAFTYDDATRTITFTVSSFSPFVFVQNVQTYTISAGDDITVENAAADVPAGTEVTVSTPSQADSAAAWTITNTSDNTSVAVTPTSDDGNRASAVFTMPDASVNVSVTFTKNKHKVTPGEGVSVDKPEAEAGDKITATVSAGAGTSVAWTITDADGNKITPESADNSTAVFTMPAADVTVTAVSSVNSHKVTINGNGTVNGGSASEDVPYGSTVTITASVGSSKEFKGWSVDQGTVTLADASKSETTFTMPDADVALSFSEADVLYKISTDSHITIDDDRNSVPQGTTITVTAEEAGRGYQLDGVAVSDNTVSVSSLGSRKYSFIMPANDVTVTASYSELPGYAVTVTSGKAANDYSDNKFYAGDNVTITANDPQAGYRFKEWKVTSGNVTLEDTTSDVTTFTMPAANVQLEAVYEKITYKLTVNNGDGDGEYTAGTKVNLTADWPADGKEFSSWKVTSGTANVSSSDRFYAVITMPAQDVTVEAVYKDGPSADNNYIDGITQNQECLKNSAITFTAVGDGMGNTNPNPGDYRYRPTGYAIGNVNGSYNNSSYKTTMSISTTGKYTLTVNFTKDVYKDGSWVSDGSTVSRTVTFNVVDALSVKTGDTNPILPLVIVTAAALAVIIILIVVKARSKKRNR